MSDPEERRDGDTKQRVGAIALIVVVTNIVVAAASFLDGTTKAITAVQSAFNTISFCHFVGGEIDGKWFSHVPSPIRVTFERSGCHVRGDADQTVDVPRHHMEGDYDETAGGYVVKVDRFSNSNPRCVDKFHGKIVMVSGREMFSTVTNIQELGCVNQANLLNEARFWEKE